MFRVRLATKEYCVALPPNGDATARYVKQYLVDNDEDLQVSPTQLRLMVKGKILADGDILDASQTVAAPALVHILPSQHEIEAMHAREAEAKRIHDIRMTRHVVNIQARNEELTSRAHASTTYKFHAIETLPNMPNEATARNILESLATDPGILAVLAQHKWHVGALVEMFPDGKVGVDPVCVLGLNENKGQRIRLRLRTDDLLGFRKFLTIKQVLFHELSHNDVSDHNPEFYQLMRQVEAECNAIPMTRTTPLVRSVVQQQSSVGHRLGLGPSPPLPSSGNLPQPPNTLPSAAPRPELQTPPHSHARPSQQPGVEKAPSSPEAALPRAVLDDASQPKDGSARRDHIADARSTTPKAPSTPLPLSMAPLLGHLMELNECAT
ncbi:hypothetical protein, variant [Aphanomyces invadans]|uniref:WLM domain-containing protein n=1 Tax=Aphanomyces invadans TaxID=157072 RepID=A0A024T9X3_9STRA|nr:hypothetical protein, variant [Aphanomyces invadans]ETV90809.1 hypothetical protein, variant [Aphanomyces invadans]|eukprot:XP_008880566.1 hypothetical protein, variant [Aphanomyces invadans]